MTILGNSQDARLIYSWVHESKKDPYAMGRGSQGAPEGWKFLGYGSFRSAWLSPDGVVYKVEHYYPTYGGPDFTSDNSKEYRNWLLWRKCELPARVRLPEVTLYENGGKPVIAMECVRGDVLRKWRGVDIYNPNSWSTAFKFYQKLMHAAEDALDGMSDMHDENCMVDDETGELVIVDLQM